VIAVKQATKTIPIVMAGVGDPLGSGIVTSLAHPDGNVTGVALFGAELAGKRVAVFKEAVPGLGSVGVLGNATNLLNTKLLWPQTQAGARSLGLEARLFTVREAAELSEAFDDMARDHAGGLVVLSDALLNSERRTIIGLAAQHRLAAIYEGREFVADGGLLSYGPNLSEMIRRAGGFIDKILKGAKPADLPIEQPTEFELVINLKTAKALGLTIAESFLVRADEVIE
jgi:putative ABC transport system substrate-binding protein